MDSQKHQVLFILGGPGSGKGTQCENLVNNYGCVHYSTGDLLRAEVKKGTELGQEIDSYISQGNLVPGEVTAKMLLTAITSQSPQNLFIIDGYPRNQSNIDNWEKVVGEKVDVLGCLYLECAEEVMRERIMQRGQGRSDDNEEVFANRIKVFHSETVPILNHFEKEDKLFRVSAEGSKEECFAEVQQVLKKLGLQNLQKIKEMREYITEKIDPYVKPMIVHLMKVKPESVHAEMKKWLDEEGAKLKGDIEGDS